MAVLIYLGELLAKGIGDIVSGICRDYENCFTDLIICMTKYSDWLEYYIQV